LLINLGGGCRLPTASAEGEQFLGVAIVRGSDFLLAVARAHVLGVNPGGEVRGWQVPDDHALPEGSTDRLLSRAELDRLFGDIVQAPPSDQDCVACDQEETEK